MAREVRMCVAGLWCLQTQYSGALCQYILINRQKRKGGRKGGRKEHEISNPHAPDQWQKMRAGRPVTARHQTLTCNPCQDYWISRSQCACNSLCPPVTCTRIQIFTHTTALSPHAPDRWQNMRVGHSVTAWHQTLACGQDCLISRAYRISFSHTESPPASTRLALDLI